MSARGALLKVATVFATVAVGSALIVGASASGSPRTAGSLPSTLPLTAPAQPTTTLHLPTTLRLVDQTTGATKIDSTHPVYTSAIAKRTAPSKVIGVGARSCSSVGLVQCNAALALKGGVLLIFEKLDVGTAVITGKVVGGSGQFAGAGGSVSGSDRGNGKFYLTVSYYLT